MNKGREPQHTSPQKFYPQAKKNNKAAAEPSQITQMKIRTTKIITTLLKDFDASDLFDMTSLNEVLDSIIVPNSGFHDLYLK